MNMLAAEAELAVRSCRWGEGIGGVASKDEDFVKLNTSAYFSSLKVRASKQEQFERRMTEKLLSN